MPCRLALSWHLSSLKVQDAHWQVKDIDQKTGLNRCDHDSMMYAEVFDRLEKMYHCQHKDQGHIKHPGWNKHPSDSRFQRQAYQVVSSEPAGAMKAYACQGLQMAGHGVLHVLHVKYVKVEWQA